MVEHNLKLFNFDNALVETPEQIPSISQFINLISVLDKSEYYSDGREIIIVSVGCGTGYTEQILLNSLSPYITRPVEIICIDPKQNSYQKGDIVIESSYQSVDLLIRNRADIVNNCVLINIWPNPQPIMRAKNTIEYCYSSIIDLDPLAIYTFYGPCGGSGSNLYTKFFNSDYKYLKIEGKIYSDLDYKILTRYTYVQGTGSGFNGASQELCIIIKNFITDDVIEDLRVVENPVYKDKVNISGSELLDALMDIKFRQNM